MENLKEKLKQALARREIKRIDNPALPKSAVLMPVSYQEGEHYLLFTRRTQTVKYHKGEMSFPGGGYEERDGTLVNTALRESFEEIGLAPGDVEILGELDDIVTRYSNYIVSPFVAYIPASYQFKLNAEEAAEVVVIPIIAFFDKECVRDAAEPVAGCLKAITRTYHYRGTAITGATARILRQFLEIFAQVAGQKQER